MRATLRRVANLLPVAHDALGRTMALTGGMRLSGLPAGGLAHARPAKRAAAAATLGAIAFVAQVGLWEFGPA